VDLLAEFEKVQWQKRLNFVRASVFTASSLHQESFIRAATRSILSDKKKKADAGKVDRNLPNSTYWNEEEEALKPQSFPQGGAYFGVACSAQKCQVVASSLIIFFFDL